jgi:glyceraldehyde 3-phosphate dehydrogenase
MAGGKSEVALHGFGRFGLHLLKYYLDRFDQANFFISHISDEAIHIEQAYQMIMQDPKVNFRSYQVSKVGNVLVFVCTNNRRIEINYSCVHGLAAEWLGRVDLVFECSGRLTQASACRSYLIGATSRVLISATSWDADATLIYGFNEAKYHSDMQVISYGSCTVNAFIPVAQFFHDSYKVIACDVNVIHNTPQHRLTNVNEIQRHFCTLEKIGPRLLSFLTSDNFHVNYCLIPYSGLSMMHYRFHLENATNVTEIKADLLHACEFGSLTGLYEVISHAQGSHLHHCTTYSAVIIRDSIKLVGKQLYFSAYLDNENSVNRYFDLVQSVLKH